MWCWTDEWFGLTMEDIRKLEAETKAELENRIKENEKRGLTN